MSEHIRLDPVPVAIAAIAAGRPVVVVDDADRENEGDLIYAAALATEEERTTERPVGLTDAEESALRAACSPRCIETSGPDRSQ